MQKIIINNTQENVPFTHPETGTAEVFFTNASLAAYNRIPFLTKRLGVVAYDGNGSPLSDEDWFPVFLDQDEVAESSRALSDLRAEHRRMNP